jgi:hypothetical protein
VLAVLSGEAIVVGVRGRGAVAMMLRTNHAIGQLSGGGDAFSPVQAHMTVAIATLLCGCLAQTPTETGKTFTEHVLVGIFISGPRMTLFGLIDGSDETDAIVLAVESAVRNLIFLVLCLKYAVSRFVFVGYGEWCSVMKSELIV